MTRSSAIAALIAGVLVIACAAPAGPLLLDGTELVVGGYGGDAGTLASAKPHQPAGAS